MFAPFFNAYLPPPFEKMPIPVSRFCNRLFRAFRKGRFLSFYAFLEKIEREKREFFFKEKESWVKKGLKRQKNGI